MTLRSLLFSLLLTSSAFSASAQGTRLWVQSHFTDFEKGKPEGVAISSDGHLEPGPELKQLFATLSTYVWSVASDHAGNAYVGTGSPATVLQVSASGKSKTLFTSKDLSVQAVRVSPDGSVYAATLPSGKVYRLKPDAAETTETTAAVAFDPSATADKPKYVWDLAFDAQGRLYIATGGPAGIYRVTPGEAGSKAELFFKSDEQHIRAIAFDRNGNLIAGSDGTGLIYRIDPQGKGYVLYDAPKHEITALSIADNGTIYASAVGEKGHNPLPPLPVQGNATVTATIQVVQPGSMQSFNGNTVIPDGSEIYEIPSNGAPRRLWTGHDDIVYALRATPEGLLAATGNRGHIYRIDESGEFADLGHAEASQAVGFADAPNGLYVATANSGKVYTLSKTNSSDGSYISDVFDAGVFSRWGRAELQPGSQSTIDFFARAGNVENPERAWSDWKPISPNSAALDIPSARFVQWKAVLHRGATLTSVGLNYLPVNVAPEVDEVMVAPGARATPPIIPPNQPQAISLNLPSVQNASVNFNPEGSSAPLAAIKDRTAITIRWSAHDDNGDDLHFSVFYRGAHEQNWQLLKDKISDRFYSFDASLIPDGVYRVKILAADSPSHNPGESLTGERVSDLFTVDTTPPTLGALKADLVNTRTCSGSPCVDGAIIHATITATDSTSPIARAEYSIDAGPWHYIEPIGKLSDSREERYEFDAPIVPARADQPPPADSDEHVITMRIYDRYDNMASAKTVVHPATSRPPK